MQQTEKYKLNLIERDDPFLPEALNDNTRRIEAALDAHEAAVDNRVDALDQRVTVLEGHRVAVGQCEHSHTSPLQTIHLGFTPKAIYVRSSNGSAGTDYLIVEGAKQDTEVTIVEGGFTVGTSLWLSSTFFYLAIA